MEEDIKILETLKESYIKASECGLGYPSDNREDKRTAQALDNLIKGYRELEEYYKEQNEVNAKFIPKSKIKKLKEENEINIDKMRPYKHQSPFDFGVLNGIDECCRKLLEDK